MSEDNEPMNKGMCRVLMEKMETNMNNLAEQNRDIKGMFRAIMVSTFTTMGAAIGALLMFALGVR